LLVVLSPFIHVVGQRTKDVAKSARKASTKDGSGAWQFAVFDSSPMSCIFQKSVGRFRDSWLTALEILIQHFAPDHEVQRSVAIFRGALGQLLDDPGELILP
jgi:hypothetical protein